MSLLDPKYLTPNQPQDILKCLGFEKHTSNGLGVGEIWNLEIPDTNTQRNSQIFIHVYRDVNGKWDGSVFYLFDRAIKTGPKIETQHFPELLVFLQNNMSDESFG